MEETAVTQGVLGNGRPLAEISKRRVSKKVVGAKRRADTHERTLNLLLREKYKNDLRGPNAVLSAVESIVVNPAIPISVNVNPNIFGDILLPVMSYALSRGFSLNSNNDNYIYWSWVYQTNLLRFAAQGGVPQTATIPKWLALLYQAVVQTNVPYRGGRVAYQMTVTQTWTPNWIQMLGPAGSQRAFNLGVKQATLVNGLFPEVTIPSAYSDDLGREATQQLWQFLSSDAEGGHHRYPEMHRMVSASEENVMTNDVSAFSWFSNTPGGGQNASGGWFKLVWLEPPIRKPIFAVFSPLVKHPVEDRAQCQQTCGSGDALTLGSMLVDGLSTKQLGFKTPIAFKFIDFNEFADVLAMTVREAIQLRLQTDTFIENIKNDAGYYISDVQCPLSIQEMTILLRATLMLVYTDTKAAQGIYPRQGQGNEFVVFNSGVSTYPIPYGAQMLLPMYLQENILALRSRAVMNGSRGKKNPDMHLAALGMFGKDRLNTDDYLVEYTVNDVSVGSNAFNIIPGEVVIDLVDGSHGANPASYAAINDPYGLAKLTERWNFWVQEMGDHFRRVGSIDTDSGINALAAIGFTTHFITLSEDRRHDCKAEAKAKKAPPKSKFIEPKKKLGTTFYDQRKIIAVSAAGEVFDEIWSSYQQYFVTPCNRIDPGTTAEDSTGYKKMASFLREPRQVDVGSGSVRFESLKERHRIMAEMSVKTKFAQSTVQEKVLTALEESGHAGLLGSVSGALVGALGHAGVEVASQLLSNNIPF